MVVAVSVFTIGQLATAWSTSSHHAGAAGSGSVTMSGTMTVTALSGGEGASVTVNGGSCTADGPFSDVNTGTPVTVYDQTGSVVAITQLGAGTGRVLTRPSGAEIYVGTCQFPFSVEVPGSDFYQVEISSRGRITVPKAQAGNVRATLSAG